MSMPARRTRNQLFRVLRATTVGAAISSATLLHAQQSDCRTGAAPLQNSDIVTLRAVGDIVLGSDWPTANYPEWFEPTVRARLRQVLGDADVKFGNFEGVLSTHKISTKKTRPGAVYAFRMPPRFAPLLRDAGFDIMNVANNHSFDFGQTGYDDTVAHLSGAGMLTVGEKDQVTVQRVRNVALAWIGFSYLNRLNDMHDTEALAALIERARRAADLVIVSVHAGAEGSDALRVTEGEEIFLGEQRGNVLAFARHAVDLGADLVLGHGPHVLRGMECYKGKLIAYSLGNFIGYNALSARRAAALSAILEVKLGKNRQTLGFDLISLKFDEQNLPESDGQDLARQLVDDLSGLAPLGGRLGLADGTPSEAYRAWLKTAGLERLLATPPPRREGRKPR